MINCLFADLFFGCLYFVPSVVFNIYVVFLLKTYEYYLHLFSYSSICWIFVHYCRKFVCIPSDSTDRIFRWTICRSESLWFRHGLLLFLFYLCIYLFTIVSVRWMSWIIFCYLLFFPLNWILRICLFILFFGDFIKQLISWLVGVIYGFFLFTYCLFIFHSFVYIFLHSSWNIDWRIHLFFHDFIACWFLFSFI